MTPRVVFGQRGFAVTGLVAETYHSMLDGIRAELEERDSEELSVGRAVDMICDQLRGLGLEPELRPADGLRVMHVVCGHVEPITDWLARPEIRIQMPAALQGRDVVMAHRNCPCCHSTLALGSLALVSVEVA